MKSKSKLISCILVLCLALPLNSFAHSGGTNSSGCHKDNINGGSHCHNSKDSEFSGGGILLATVIVVCLSVLAEKAKSSADFNLKESGEIKSPWGLSLAPTSKTKFDGISLQMTYAF